MNVNRLEPREQPSATAVLAAGTLTISADAAGGRLDVFEDGSETVVRSDGQVIGSFTGVTAIIIQGGAGNDVIRVTDDVTAATQINGGDGVNKISAGGGATILTGGPLANLLIGGSNANQFSSIGLDEIYKAQPGDPVVVNALTKLLTESIIPPPADTPGLPQETITSSEVEQLLRRASAASASSDAIIVITDRNGRILGVRVESQVAPEIRLNNANLVFAIDGAVSKARTGAFFGNNQAPLTSRTVRYISQSTVTQREVESNPNDPNPNSTVRGPGFVAPVGIGGHFPPNIAFTPQVDLFGIEHTNRDGTFHVGPDGIKGTADDVELDHRFNTTDAFTLQELFPPDSYGFDSGLLTTAQSRGIATLPGGIPLFKNGQVVGGIGVFFPGKTGYATQENSSLGTTYDPTKADRSLEAEWIAFATAGGITTPINGVNLPSGFSLPSGRIDLVGIQLDVFGPGGEENGPKVLRQVGAGVGVGNPNDGVNQIVTNDANGDGTTGDTATLRGGLAVPDGWIVAPHDGVGISKSDVEMIIANGINQANDTRAAIRLPLGSRTKMVFAVADRNGEIVGLYRMPDATVFSIDVAVAKARNVAYYADPAKLQGVDQLPGVAAGAAFSNRTFRYLANPRFPTGIDGTPPGWFSQLRDGGIDPLTGRTIGAPLPASAYQSVFGHDAFNPGTNFRDPTNKLNQNGIIFFPGSAPLYRGRTLIGGFGVSGDGVDQDDVVTAGGQVGFGVPASILRADQVIFQGVRLPYQKFNRNPEG